MHAACSQLTQIILINRLLMILVYCVVITLRLPRILVQLSHLQLIYQVIMASVTVWCRNTWRNEVDVNCHRSLPPSPPPLYKLTLPVFFAYSNFSYAFSYVSQIFRIYHRPFKPLTFVLVDYSGAIFHPFFAYYIPILDIQAPTKSGLVKYWYFQ